MRIVDKNNSIQDIADVVFRVARYQKTVVCIDENSDIKFIDSICQKLSKDTIVFKCYYNHRNMEDLFNLINTGVRVVIYNVSINHFYQMAHNNNFLLNIFIPQSSFVLPYVAFNESVYGDNLLVCDLADRDYASLAILYDIAFNDIWESIVRCENVDTSIFKNIDEIANCKAGFYEKLIDVTKRLGNKFYGYNDCDETDIPSYIFIKLSKIITMLESVNYGKEEYIDFYKTEQSSDEINRAHSLIVRNNVIELLRLNSSNLIKINIAILNRIKIIVKKYFNFKNSNINKLNKIIKNQSKTLNIDSLLYVSYILNTV